MRQNVYTWVKLEQLDDLYSDSDVILVNSNRIYWRISEVGRKMKNTNEKEHIISTLTQKLTDSCNDQSMYIPMQISAIKECFKNSQDLLPLNTFVKVEITK